MTRTSRGALGPARRLVYAFGADLHVAADVRRDERWWCQTDLDKLEKRLGTVTRHVTDDPNVARAVFPTARDAEPCLICMATHGRARVLLTAPLPVSRGWGLFVEVVMEAIHRALLAGQVELAKVGEVRAGDGVLAWVVVDGDGCEIEPFSVFLRDLALSDASPLTGRSYGHDLLRWWRLLGVVEVPWDRATRSEVELLVGWLRNARNPQRDRRDPASAPAGSVNLRTGKPTLRAGYAPSTINHALTVLSAFYAFHLQFGRGREGMTFWAWAVVETLRLTGVRIEELLELSQLSIRQYQRPNGEVIALLVIAPSKTDRERVIPMSAELLHVMACIIRRLTRDRPTVPLATRFDKIERITSDPQPFLFQRRLGQRNEVLSNGAVNEMLRRTCAHVAQRHPRVRRAPLQPPRLPAAVRD